MTAQRVVKLSLALAALCALALVAAVGWHNWGRSAPVHDFSAPVTPELLSRGAVLTRAGNCIACHTAPGGAAGAGGLAIVTPFGRVYSSNITPDASTGLGAWSAQDFWQALHLGRSRDGRLLAPAFPYPHTTRITADDAHAIWAHLRQLSPVTQAQPAHTLRWPYGTQAALAMWRTLYFRPGVYQPDGKMPPEWNRGAYLVKGAAHCGACHAPRDAWGGSDADSLGGGGLPGQGWFAPSLMDPHEGGVADWPMARITTLLKTGYTPEGDRASGPMADVVQHSLQHLPDADVTAIATYLKSIGTPSAAPAPPAPSSVPRMAGTTAAQLRAARLYADHCADCHGSAGQGRRDTAGQWAYPPLVGNRAVSAPRLTPNLLQHVLYGGFGPVTAAVPQPYGMPPFVLQLSNDDMAAVLTHLRQGLGGQPAGEAVTPLQVMQWRQSQSNAEGHPAAR